MLNFFFFLFLCMTFMTWLFTESLRQSLQCWTLHSRVSFSNHLDKNKQNQEKSKILCLHACVCACKTEGESLIVAHCYVLIQRASCVSRTEYHCVCLFQRPAHAVAKVWLGRENRREKFDCSTLLFCDPEREGKLCFMDTHTVVWLFQRPARAVATSLAMSSVRPALCWRGWTREGPGQTCTLFLS